MLDSSGSGCAIVDTNALGLGASTLLGRLTFLKNHGLVRSFSFSKDGTLTVYLASIKSIATRYGITLGVCFWAGPEHFNSQDIVRNTTLAVAQSLQSKAAFRIKSDGGFTCIDGNDIVNDLQDFESTTGLDRDELLASKTILPAILGRRVIGYNASQKTLILVDGVSVAAASYEGIAASLGVSSRTVCRHLRGFQKVRIGYMVSEKEAQTDPRGNGRYVRFNRANGVQMVVRMGCNLLLEDRFVLASKRKLKLIVKN
jgi:hypothetical protein